MLIRLLKDCRGGIAPLKGGEADTCELQKWYILPEYRGYGYGRLLFDRLLEAVKEQGFRRCYIETFEHMKDAAKFYEQSGFKKIDGPMGSTGHFACNRWYVKDM